MKVLLMSGGLDSSAIAWWKRPDLCVTLDYGQVAAKGEIAASTALCAAMGLNYRTIRADLSALGSGTMSGGRPVKGAAAAEFWPFRNQMLVTLAAMALLPLGAREIMLGAVATDHHADGKEPFIRSLDGTMALQEGGVRVTAPALHLTTPELLRTSGFPYELIGLTFSCHVHEYACGQCGGCEKHRVCIEEAYDLLPAEEE